MLRIPSRSNPLPQVVVMRCTTLVAYAAVFVVCMIGTAIPRAAAESIATGTPLCPGPSPLCNPDSPDVNLRAPDAFRVQFETSKGKFVLSIMRQWAPYGVDRFYNLVRAGYYNLNKFYRVLPAWVCQWGVNGDPSVSGAWADKHIPDDPVVLSNIKGTLAYSAAYNPDKSWATNRTTELYVNYHNNSRLDKIGFAPFGNVISGMDVIEAFYSGYGEMCATSAEPNCDGHIIETRLYAEGNAYLNADFPLLDFATTAMVLNDPNPAIGASPAPGLGHVLMAAGFMLALAVLLSVLVRAGWVWLDKRQEAQAMHSRLVHGDSASMGHVGDSGFLDAEAGTPVAGGLAGAGDMGAAADLDAGGGAGSRL